MNCLLIALIAGVLCHFIVCPISIKKKIIGLCANGTTVTNYSTGFI